MLNLIGKFISSINYLINSLDRRTTTNIKHSFYLLVFIMLIIAGIFGQLNIVVSTTNENFVSIEADSNMWCFNSSWDTYECSNYSTGNAISHAYVNSTIGFIYGLPSANETGGGKAEGWMMHSVEWDCPMDNESGVINVSYEYYAFAILIMPAFWILLAIGALYYVGGWWLGVPAIIASLVIIGMWES